MLSHNNILSVVFIKYSKCQTGCLHWPAKGWQSGSQFVFFQKPEALGFWTPRGSVLRKIQTVKKEEKQNTQASSG